MKGTAAGKAKSVSAERTFAPNNGLTGLPTFCPLGQVEQATPLGAPINTPNEPCVMGPPIVVSSV
ncbi:hypothetical protein EYY88_04600 [Hafnia alvei]|nr:hypothetical protein EYY88_04600 [Hafnia alvei]